MGLGKMAERDDGLTSLILQGLIALFGEKTPPAKPASRVEMGTDLLSALERVRAGRTSEPGDERLYASNYGLPDISSSGETLAVPFGDISDPVSQLALFVAPYLRAPGLARIAAPPQEYRALSAPADRLAPRGAPRGVPTPQTAALPTRRGPSLVEQMQADDAANAAAFAQRQALDAARYNAHREALRQWTVAHYPSQPAPQVFGEADPYLVREELAALIEKYGWNPAPVQGAGGGGRVVRELGTPMSEPATLPHNVSPPVRIEDVISSILGGRK